MAGEKTEKATPKRRQDERKKGNIFTSREVITLMIMICMFYGLQAMAPYYIRSIENSFETFLGYTSELDLITPDDIGIIFIEVVRAFVSTVVPMLLLCTIATITVTFFQTKMLFSMESVKPKLSKLNPISGIGKLFSLRNLVEAAKSILKISILGYVIYRTLIKEMNQIPRLMDMGVAQVMGYTGSVVMDIVRTAAIAMAFVAAADYFYQWYEYEKKLRMSKQEIKEEYKQTEGDPQIKGKIKERQRQQAQKRMMQKVPTADVVIRNPTHYAVAIKYTPGDIAPVVVAKGADNLAMRIIAVAEEHDVAVTENRPLARGLYETVELDQMIPERFYQPVAEVLAFVYSLSKKDMVR